MTDQGRHESHFGANPNGLFQGASRPLIDFDAMAQGSGAEVDRHGSQFSFSPDNPVQGANVSSGWSKTSAFGKGTSASEQDRYGSHFSFV